MKCTFKVDRYSPDCKVRILKFDCARSDCVLKETAVLGRCPGIGNPLQVSGKAFEIRRDSGQLAGSQNDLGLTKRDKGSLEPSKDR